ncbi:hypothetical protein V6N00_13325 [Tersicoccus sp. MR15.9]|uniref:hypothetical protein n=1 Tax=Tersicoccus mangrovi TaxID=3121635 RepID=UPI002FE5F0AE
MSNTIQPHKPAGVPGAGQFDTMPHTESAVSLAATAEPRRPELEGWPESLPEPEVDFDVQEDGSVNTTVKVGDGEIWVYRGGYDLTANLDLAPKTEDAALDWATTKHRMIQQVISQEMRAAADRVSARVLAQVTGKTTVMTDEQLESHAIALDQARNAAEEQSQLAHASLGARAILADYPTAAYVELDSDEFSNGTFYTEAHIRDTDGNQLGYLDNETPAMGEHLSNLPVDRDAFWTTFGGSHEGQMDRLDLRAAAAWNPGA